MDEDETEDSEDSEYDKPEPSRLWFMPTLLPEPTAQLQSCSPEPTKTIKEEHVQPPEVDTTRCLDDEETEDSEDCDDDGNAVSTKHLPHQPPRSDLGEKPSRSPEPATVTTERSVKPSAERQAEDKTTMDVGDGSRNPKGPLLLTLLQPSHKSQTRNTEPAESKAEQKDEASAGVLSLQPGHNRNPEPRKLKEPVRRPGHSKTSKPSPAVVPVPLLPCKVCNNLRGSENMLIKHAWTHVNERGMLCGVCGERSESTDELRHHLQTHQKTHNCTICGKSFLTLICFRAHMNQHEGKTPHKCPTCHKTFALRAGLRKHLLLHKEERKCTSCHRSFSSNITLKLHLLTHPDRKQDAASPQTSAALGPAHTPAKEKRFGCEICPKSFFTKKALRKHEARHKARCGKATPTA